MALVIVFQSSRYESRNRRREGIRRVKRRNERNIYCHTRTYKTNLSVKEKAERVAIVLEPRQKMP
eukprot:scaffold422977_cov35-Attheya_sp.AAC.1